MSDRGGNRSSAQPQDRSGTPAPNRRDRDPAEEADPSASSLDPPVASTISDLTPEAVVNRDGSMRVQDPEEIVPRSTEPESTGSVPDGATESGRRAEVQDIRLVEQARAGSQDAFATLVFRYERKLVRVIDRFVHDREMARDLAQETFWKVYTRLDRFDTSRRFAPWLFRIGVNLALDQLRRQGGPSVASIDQVPGPGEESRPFEPAEADPRGQIDLVQEVRHVLERIPLPYRTILVLRDLEGLSSAEVAAIVQRREATVRWRLARAREQFRDHWLRRWRGMSWE